MGRLASFVALMAIGCAHEPPSTPNASAPASTASATPKATATVPAASSIATSSNPPPIESASSSSSSAPPSTPPASPRACTGTLPPEDRVRGNISDTESSGLAEIVKSSRTGTDGKMPAPTSGYVHFRYEVRVVKWFSGAMSSEKILLVQGAEASGVELPPGQAFFFSGCKSTSGDAAIWEPDVGYFFPIDTECREKMEKSGDAAAKKLNAATKRKAPACSKK